MEKLEFVSLVFIVDYEKQKEVNVSENSAFLNFCLGKHDESRL